MDDQAKLARVPRQEFVDRFVRLAEALPVEIDLPEDLTHEDFRRLLAAMHTVHRRSGMYWGRLFMEARHRFGQEAYQLFDWADYAESTLIRYADITEQIHPSLWNEKIPLKHFQAIGQNVKDPEEQRLWVEHSKNGAVASGEKLREEIQEDHERRGLRPKAHKTTWHVCERCNGEGGWPEP